MTSALTKIKARSYYPFGMVMQTYSPADYRYGFNGKEKDIEGMGGGGSTYDYGFRIYNPQIAKFLSVDPLAPSYPWYTPYQFAGNTPIQAIDLDGLEGKNVISYSSSISQEKIKNLNADVLILINSSAEKAGVTALLVNSLARSPKEQARVMYEDTSPDKYKAAGTSVQKVMTTMKNSGATKDATIDAMEKKILEVGPSNVSNHCGDFNVVNTVDFSLGSFDTKEKWENFLNEMLDLKKQGLVKEVQYPTRFGVQGNNTSENALHVSFYVKAGTGSGKLTFNEKLERFNQKLEKMNEKLEDKAAEIEAGESKLQKFNEKLEIIIEKLDKTN